MSLLISGATVVSSIDPPVVSRADVLVEEGRIVAVGPHSTAGAGGGGSSRPVILEAAGCVVVPGNVNAHMHAYSALARGMPYHLAPPTNFIEILQRIWWRLDRALDPASIRASALVAGREALLAGTTTLIDHHASPSAIDGSLDIIAEGFAELGIRAVLAYEVTDRDGAHGARAGVSENARFLRRVARGQPPLARAMVGAHASFTLSDDTLAEVADLARSTGSGVHIHVAEDADDEADSLARSGRRVVDRLADAGALGERTLLAHAVHIDPAEAAQVLAAHATVVHNPRSNMNNGVGRTPLGLLGERVALGTDGIGSDMWAESRAGFFRRREEDMAIDADWALRRLAVGARLAGRAFHEPLLGTIAAGAPADLTVLDYAAPGPLDPGSLAGHWIFGIGAAGVRDVIVAGEVVVRDRGLTRVDGAELSAFATRQARRLWRRMDELDAHPYEPAARSVSATGGK